MMENPWPIEFVRGDTKILPIDAFDIEGDPYTPRDGDTVTMTVRKYHHKGVIAFQKVTGDGDVVAVEGGWQITLRPDDTAGLEYIPYVYDVEVLLADGYKETGIQHSTLTLIKEVTYADASEVPA